jgi:putative transposase
VNLLQRRNSDLLVREIGLLRETVNLVRKRHPFRIDAWVVLPEHMNAVWTLPPGDADFSRRWRLIKSAFSRALPKTERRSNVRQAAGIGANTVLIQSDCGELSGSGCFSVFRFFLME